LTGTAVAAARYAEPRATIDIDVNVFTPPSRHEAVAVALEPLGVRAEADPDQIIRDGAVAVAVGAHSRRHLLRLRRAARGDG
jgi:hypothetical protein